MGRSHGARGSPPQQGFARAGLAGAPLMAAICTRVIRAWFLAGLIAALLLEFSLDPGPAFARPYGSGGPSGDPYGTGDPTGDDQPSPTPKPTAAPTSRTLTSGSLGAIHGGRLEGKSLGRFGSSNRFGFYMRLLVRLAIR